MIKDRDAWRDNTELVRQGCPANCNCEADSAHNWQFGGDQPQGRGETLAAQVLGPQ